MDSFSCLARLLLRSSSFRVFGTGYGSCLLLRSSSFRGFGTGNILGSWYFGVCTAFGFLFCGCGLQAISGLVAQPYNCYQCLFRAWIVWLYLLIASFFSVLWLPGSFAAAISYRFLVGLWFGWYIFRVVVPLIVVGLLLVDIYYKKW